MSELLTTAPEGQPDNATTTTTSGYDLSSALSVEYQNNPSITKFGGDVNKLAKSYLELQGLMGQGRVAIPKDDNDVNAWGLYDKAFGVPDAATGYELTAPDGADLTGFKDLMKQNHISPTVAQKLLDAHLSEFSNYEALKKQEAEVAKNAAETALKQEWGLKYPENMSKANKYLEKMSENQEDYKYFLDKIGNDAKFIKLLARMGDNISEGSLGGMEGQVSGFTKTPSEAKAELDRIMNDPEDAYWAGSRNKRNDPAWCKQNNKSFVSEQERKARVNYVLSLMQMQG
ncbi:MAG: hypothetical protein E7017_01595 [Alphaproteobacteria bacterium]|nr:hypothetical protein [Alphaproteobacteria bacterium]